MKAIILTMTSGEGHNRMARVLTSQFAQMGIESETIDIFKHDGFEFNFNDRGYLFLCSYLPNCYDYFWRKLKFRKSERRYHGVAMNEIKKVADHVAAEAEQKNGDFFVAVHPYSAVLCDLWKRQGRFPDKKAFAILPDMLPHPLWESAIECDNILVPTEHCFEQLDFKGFKKEQIVVTGFPVATQFSEVADKTEMRGKLNLKNKFTVLVISGGFGIGKNWKVVKKLLGSDVQILCINGHNKKAYKKTAKLAAKHPDVDIFNFGFVDNVHELMSASDVIVARGGGGSVFEAMAKHLPMILREKLIINERENADILQREGAGIKLKRLKDLKNVVDDLKGNPEKLAQMQEACTKFSQGRNVVTVCETIVKLLQQ